jgi:hypothetical protein
MLRAVVGKALEPLPDGTGPIQVLVALQKTAEPGVGSRSGRQNWRISMPGRATGLAVPVLLAAQLASGGEPLGVGDRVRVKATSEVTDDGTVAPRQSRDWIVGMLATADGDELSVLVAPDEAAVRMPRVAVERLEVSRGRARGKATLIGAGIGAAFGVVVGVISHEQCQSEAGDDGWCDLAWSFPMVTTPAGALLGLAIGKERWVQASPTTLSLGVVPVSGGVRVAGTVRF